MAENITLLGEPGSGKSTIGDAYVVAVGGKKLSFKDAMLLEIAWMLAAADAQDHITRNASATRILVRHYMQEMLNPATKDKYRSLQQFWGTDWRRAQDEDYWVKRFKIQFDNRPRDTPLVNDDCRFPNEMKALRAMGFKFVRLEPGETTRPLTGEQAAHDSEKYWRKFKTDLVLSYEKGPAEQAARILSAFTPESVVMTDEAVEVAIA